MYYSEIRADDCNVILLKLTALDLPEFNRNHRFVKLRRLHYSEKVAALVLRMLSNLWRRTGWSG